MTGCKPKKTCQINTVVFNNVKGLINIADIKITHSANSRYDMSYSYIAENISAAVK